MEHETSLINRNLRRQYTMKKALLVIDMQNDYLYEKRKAKFSYDTENLVNSVNSLIEKYHGENSDVIYIRHIIQNLPTTDCYLAIL